jgi:hypothetical protein
MNRAWQLIVLQQGELAGTVLIQVVGTQSRLNPQRISHMGSNSACREDRGTILMDRPFALLATALYLVLSCTASVAWAVHRRTGWRCGFGAAGTRDCGCRGGTARGKALGWRNPQLPGRSPPMGAALAFRSFRSVENGRAGSARVTVQRGRPPDSGYDATGATNWGYLPWPERLGGTWIPAAATFALAPGYHGKPCGAPKSGHGCAMGLRTAR